MQAMRGCGTQGQTATLLGKERLTTCPRYFIKTHPRTFHRLIELRQHLDSGFLPDAGGIQDQSNLTMEALQIQGTALAQARADKKTAPRGSKGR